MIPTIQFKSAPSRLANYLKAPCVVYNYTNNTIFIGGLAGIFCDTGQYGGSPPLFPGGVASYCFYVGEGRTQGGGGLLTTGSAC